MEIEADVLVVGAGPVGLTLASELARRGVRCRIIDRLSKPSPYCRAIGVTPRTLEVWEDMGIVREMIDAGIWLKGTRSIIDGHTTGDVRGILLDLPYASLGVPQYETERVLEDNLRRYGFSVERGVELASLQQHESGVIVRLVGGATETATFHYVVGCDGAHSTVRRSVDISFEGDAFPMHFMLGDVHIDWDLPRGEALRALRLVKGGAPEMFIAIPLPDPKRYRVSVLARKDDAGNAGLEHGIQTDSPGPKLDVLQDIADDLVPDKPHLSDMRWSSRFRISMRLAASYRRGRVFIAGDAAHIHPPTGGQGMNTGIQDAYNLAWKLALVIEDAASETLLDSYEAERRPVGADVVSRTRAASEGYGREAGGRTDQLTNSQVLVTYRGTRWVRDDGADFDTAAPTAGDRAPDAGGLWRDGVGYPLRLFDVLRGPDHVLITYLRSEDVERGVLSLATCAKQLSVQQGARLRVVAILETAIVEEQFGVVCLFDKQRSFAYAYGARGSFLVRPDGHIGWRGPSWRDDGLQTYLNLVFRT